MIRPLEYHRLVRHSIPSSVALLSLVVLLPAILATGSQAQINGAPPSVTSPGFGGRPINGTPPSVTSVRNGFAPNSGVSFGTSFVPRNREGHHHHHNYVEYPPLVYAIPVPYPVDLGATTDDPDDNDAEDQGGPTIFDRHGSGADSYIPPVRNVPKPHAVVDAASDPEAADDPPQVPTLLVFKDGHKLEVGNYAIVGATLFDLTPGHARRVALADLDLDATRLQNDDRGVIFQLPPTRQAN